MKRYLSTSNVSDSNDSALSVTSKRFRKQRMNNIQTSLSQPIKLKILDMDAVINSLAHISDPECYENQSISSQKWRLPLEVR